jgi:FtsH-binding integral membrane protein
MECKNCYTEVSQNYCPKCGLPATLKRIDKHYVAHEIIHLLHFEKGILYTVRQLIADPGTTIRQFISEDRSRLVKPVVFIIFTSLIFSLTAHFLHIDRLVSYSDANNSSTAEKIFKWGDINSGYINIIIGIFIALWAKLFFRKHDYNMYEILILLCFVTGISMIIFSVFAILQGLTHLELMKIAGIFGIVYCSWAMGNFFDKKRPSSYIKSFFAYIFGLVTFSVIVVIIGAIVDSVIAH